MIKINVIVKNILWYNYIKNPNNYIDRKILKLSSKEKKLRKKKIFCTLLLSGNRDIKYLNKKFRKKNKTTDVLSFPFQIKKELNNKLKKNDEVYLGDIIINLNSIKNRDILRNFKIEFDHLWIHGLVHLFGHDHKREKDFKKMSFIEKKYIQIINDRKNFK
tara:strand:+ start:150 stop:632 length:483 start_codon:yes stop_codon:yes gene_type:complete